MKAVSFMIYSNKSEKITDIKDKQDEMSFFEKDCIWYLHMIETGFND